MSELDAPLLLDDEVQMLHLPVHEGEIKQALWSLKPFKSPGPNGVHASFFQRIFHSKKIPFVLNQTFIAFIPKIKGLETIGNFEPINLYNSVHKIITKILVAMIRPYLEKLVSPY